MMVGSDAVYSPLWKAELMDQTSILELSRHAPTSIFFNGLGTLEYLHTTALVAM